jgi:hypothetical protein
MRVLTVLESPSWIERHIVGALHDMGHEVVRHPYGPYLGEFYGRARWQERSDKNRALLEHAHAVKGERLDLIFCYVSDDFMMVETARALSQLGVPVVNYGVDTNSQWYRHIRTARYFTFMLCGQRENMDNLARYGARVFYFPFGGRAPTPEEEASTFAPAAPVTFVGTPIPYRAWVLQQVERAGISLAVYGRGWVDTAHSIGGPVNWEKALSDLSHYGWPRLRAEGFGALSQALARRLPTIGNKPAGGNKATARLSAAAKQGFVPEEGLVALFKRSTINIGITRLECPRRNAPGRQQVKVRDFEVPLAGGFYLVEYMPGHREFFEVGKEIETWRTVGELVEKIRYYLNHEADRRAIAEAGRQRALTSHTWAHRFRSLFDALGLH